MSDEAKYALRFQLWLCEVTARIGFMEDKPHRVLAITDGAKGNESIWGSVSMPYELGGEFLIGEQVTVTLTKGWV